MIFWTIAIIILLIVEGLLIYFLLKQKNAKSSDEAENDLDLGMYKRQWQEVEQDLKRGNINQKEADEARLELSRLMLAAKKNVGTPQSARFQLLTRSIIIALMVVIPVGTLGLYYMLGSPQQPATPFQQLMDKDPSKLTPDEIITKLEVLYSRNPNDGKLADQLAALYVTAGESQKAVNTYIDALRLNGESARRLVGYGFALAQYEGGVISPKAQQAFQKAAEIAPQDFYPRLMIATALAQDKGNAAAAKYLEDFRKTLPENYQDMALLEREILRYNDPEAADQREREAVIKLLQNFEHQLQSQPNHLEAWQKLIQGWVLVGNPDKARQIYDQARQVLKGENAQSLTQFVNQLGLNNQQ